MSYTLTNLGVEVVMLKALNRLSIQQHLALLRKVEIFQKTHTGALPTAWRSHKGSHFSGTQEEWHPLQKDPFQTKQT